MSDLQELKQKNGEINCGKEYKRFDVLKESEISVFDIIIFIIFVILGMILLITTLLIPIKLFDYIQACENSKMYNSLNDTNYTCSDFFWNEYIIRYN